MTENNKHDSNHAQGLDTYLRAHAPSPLPPCARDETQLMSYLSSQFTKDAKNNKPHWSFIFKNIIRYSIPVTATVFCLLLILKMTLPQFIQVAENSDVAFYVNDTVTFIAGLDQVSQIDEQMGYDEKLYLLGEQIALNQQPAHLNIQK